MTIFTPHEEHFLDICRLAYLKGASDIHFEPTKEGCSVRFRIDGVLTKIKDLNKSEAKPFHSDSRMYIGFDPHTIGSPQDSRFSHPEELVDFRANLMPVKYGEKIVLRLLERGKDFNLENYPLFQEPKNALFKALKKKQGLIIVSGPTGSGKSTLLYSALGSLDRKSLNISTIEDPIEYELSHINQAQVDVENNLTFASALRAFMRQDPDVIMVGEIRDEETAEAAMHAAATGHLVLTTIHANSSEEILTRLAGLGIAKEPIESCLLYASAQRLPKRLCAHCKVENKQDLQLLTHLYPDKKIDFLPKSSNGCAACQGTGIKGRVLLFEFIKRTDSGHSKLELMGSLKDSAFEEVKLGNISTGEAYGQFN